MHEFSIATQLLDKVLEAARLHGAARVTAVEVEVGALQLVVPEALQAAFRAASQATPAEGAELRLAEVPAAAVCRPCGRRFAPEVANYVCPQCGQADAEIVEGRGVVLKFIECETEGG